MLATVTLWLLRLSIAKVSSASTSPHAQPPYTARPVANLQGGFQYPFHCEIFAKRPQWQFHIGEVLTPGGIVLSGIQVYSFVGVAVDRQTRLGVAVQDVMAQLVTTGHRFLKNPGGDCFALPIRKKSH